MTEPNYSVGCFKVVLCVVLLLASFFAAGYMLGNFNKQQEIHHGNR